MGRSWVYYRLQAHATAGRAVQVRRGYWRAAPPSDGPSGDGRPRPVPHPAGPRAGCAGTSRTVTVSNRIVFVHEARAYTCRAHTPWTWTWTITNRSRTRPQRGEVMPARNPRDVMPERDPCDGRLSPWADAAADAPGWQITTPSRHLAAALATTLRSCGSDGALPPGSARTRHTRW
jgi:hypothetical protein